MVITWLRSDFVVWFIIFLFIFICAILIIAVWNSSPHLCVIGLFRNPGNRWIGSLHCRFLSCRSRQNVGRYEVAIQIETRDTFGKLRWAGLVSRMGEKNKACSVFPGPRSWREENIKWVFDMYSGGSVRGSYLAHDTCQWASVNSASATENCAATRGNVTFLKHYRSVELCSLFLPVQTETSKVI